MPYSKSHYSSKKYLPPAKHYVHIPYPNEIEGSFFSKNTGGVPFNLSSIIEFIRSRITIEEIVLVGVLIILLNEEIKDEFLLLMLVYILIF